MIPILKPDEIRKIDQQACEKLSISHSDLMELASSSASKELLEILRNRFGQLHRCSVLIACGAGNNGGDGFCIARVLSEVHDVTVVHDVMHGTMTDSTSEKRGLLSDAVRVINFAELDPQAHWDVVVDALIGTGGSSQLREPLPTHLEVLNGIDALSVAIDVPTGVDALTGEVSVDCFVADITLSLGVEKVGLLFENARSVCGRIILVPFGIPNEVVEQHASSFRYTDEDIRLWLKPRSKSTSKFDYGRVLVIGGSRTMSGAASLTAHAALRAGAGLVELVSTVVHPLTPREIICTRVSETSEGTISPEAVNTIRHMCARATVVAVGPGLGRNSATLEMISQILSEIPESVPVIIDADGLQVVSLMSKLNSNTILTPHLGEFAGIIGVDRKTLPSDLIALCDQLARDLGAVVHLKGVPSCTSIGDKRVFTINGNPGMATAGSGDVLTGIIAGLCAQHIPAFESAALGAYIHACAGDLAAERIGMVGLMASDIINAVPSVIGA